MIISEVVTLGIYALSMVFLPEYFGASGPTCVRLCFRDPCDSHFFMLPRSIIRYFGGTGVKLRLSSR
jgi:hypothetical protein